MNTLRKNKLSLESSFLKALLVSYQEKHTGLVLFLFSLQNSTKGKPPLPHPITANPPKPKEEKRREEKRREGAHNGAPKTKQNQSGAHNGASKTKLNQPDAHNGASKTNKPGSNRKVVEFLNVLTNSLLLGFSDIHRHCLGKRSTKIAALWIQQDKATQLLCC